MIIDPISICVTQPPFRCSMQCDVLLMFDGLHITGSDLKKEICIKENIKAEAFDLLLQNAHTKRNYSSEELIPRNSSIIVQRVPREDAEKLPKIQGVNTGIVTKSTVSVDSGINITGHMNPEFDKLSEADQIAHIKDVSTQKYHASKLVLFYVAFEKCSIIVFNFNLNSV
uniref:DWNN domain-containing protein n=1 Tax=Heterorhabditis bacteriophora TaxID=37862 RepID=A0A1I7WVA9_HETBA